MGGTEVSNWKLSPASVDFTEAGGQVQAVWATECT